MPPTLVHANRHFLRACKVTDGYTPPRWPDPGAPKQFHLDFYVADLDKAEAACLDAGAAKPDHQPGGERWRVLTDPAGHPFCLCVKQQG